MFAGIGGFHFGMEQAGHTCVGWVEWDKFARKSYQAIHTPDGEFTEKDINDVKAELLPKADCWCFGFPCQDISVAGKQGGFTNGKRSSLFFKVTGLIRELKEEDRPSYLFIENVKNLLSINKGWDFAKLLIEMDEIGYDVEWDVLDSAEVVPQHRERIFIVGHLRGRSTRKVFPIARENGQVAQAVKVVGDVSKTGKHQSGTVYDPSGISPTMSARDYKDPAKVVVKQLGNISDSESFGGNPQVGRVYDIDGIAPTLSTMQGGGQEPKILDDNGHKDYKFKPLDLVPTLRSQAHGNEPKVAIPVLTPDRVNKRQNGRRFKDDGNPSFTLTAQDRHGVMVKEATKKGYDIATVGDSINISQPNSKTRRGRVGHGIANTLTTTNTMATLISDLSMCKTTANRIKSAENGSDSQEPKVLTKAKPKFGRMGQQAIETVNSNNVTPGDTVNPYYMNVNKSKVSPTLTTRPEGMKTAILPITKDLRIRKLTPRECWRLQGFPDWAFNRAKQAGLSDSQLYKQAGNSVTVPVIKAIAERMVLDDVEATKHGRN